MFPVSTLVGIAIVFPLAGSLFSGSLQFKHSLLNLEKRKEDALINAVSDGEFKDENFLKCCTLKSLSISDVFKKNSLD
jgi:hypothetical protein